VRDTGGLSLVEILVATCVLSVGLVAVASGLRYAVGAVESGRNETTAIVLAEERLELFRGVALDSWDSPLLAAGVTREGYGAISAAPRFRRETTVVDRGGAGCAEGAASAVTCKTIRVAVAYREASGGEWRVELSTVLAPRP
jgi:Tfp pilus assembly protein PilV